MPPKQVLIRHNLALHQRHNLYKNAPVQTCIKNLKTHKKQDSFFIW